MNTGKCPKCDNAIDNVIIEDISLNDAKQPRWRGFSYSCPSCKTVLGIQMNPLALNVDQLLEIKKLMG
ncbi:MAG: hypothetical protein WC378_07645, partial [Opitutaceae bacterium]